MGSWMHCLLTPRSGPCCWETKQCHSHCVHGQCPRATGERPVTIPLKQLIITVKKKQETNFRVFFPTLSLMSISSGYYARQPTPIKSRRKELPAHTNCNFCYDLGGANIIEFMHVPVSLAINNEKNQQTNHEKLLPSDPCHLRDKNHIKRQFAARYGP